MASGINFVSETRKHLTSAQKKDRQYFRYAVIVVLGAFVVFLVTLAARFFFVYQLSQIEARQEEVRSAIASREDLEEKYTVFVHKLKQLSQLFGKRKDKQEALIFFNEVFGPEVQVSGIDYTGSDEDTLNFTLRAPSVFLLENVFDVLSSDEIVDKYQTVEKQGLGRADDGSYSMQLKLVFGDGANSASAPGSGARPSAEGSE